MGSFGPGVFVQCFYCEYEAENPYVFDGEFRGYVLCPWCFDFIVEQEGIPNSPAHWWATWRCQHNTRKARIFLWFSLSDAILDNIVDFLVGPPPRP